MSNVRFSKEEKQEDYKEIESMLRAGWSYTKMSEHLGRSRQYCCNIKKKLIQMEKITQKEIDDAKKKSQRDADLILDERTYQALSTGKSRSYLNKVYHYQYADINASIERIQDKLANLNVIPLEEQEKLEKLNIIKKLVKDKKTQTEISNITGIPTTTIARYFEILIENKEIQRSEIINGKLELQEELKRRDEIILALIEFNIPYDIIGAIFNITVSSIERIKRDFEDKSEEIRLRNEMILALIEFNVPYKVISAIFDISINAIAGIKRKYTKTSKNERKRKKKDIEIKEIDDKLTEMEVQIINYLKAGYSYTYISKKTKLLQKDLMEKITYLKLNHYISQKIINEALNNRRLYYRETTKELYNLGMGTCEIYRTINKDDIDEISETSIYRIIQALKYEGLIDDESVKQVVDANHDSYTAIDARILPLLKDGLTVKEIIASDASGMLTESRVRRSKARLIADKQITKEEIFKYQKKRLKKLSRQKKFKEDKEIWNYITRHGLSNHQIANKINSSIAYVKKRIVGICQHRNLSINELENLRKSAQEAIQNKQNLELEKGKKDFLEEKKRFLKMYWGKVPSENVCHSYFEKFQKLSTMGYAFDKQEIDILCYVVLYTDPLHTQDNISLVITHYLNIDDFERAEKTLCTFISFATDYETVLHFKQKTLNMINEHRKEKHLHLKTNF